MRPAPTTTRMTAEEFCDWVHRPENGDRWFELIQGEIIELPPPQKPHGVICMNLGYYLSAYVRQRRRGYITCNDSGVILERDPDTVRGPDVALYEDASTFAELHPKYGEVPPRVAVEVLSPSDRASRVIHKINDYLHNGVELVWVIDPETRQITAYRPDRAPVVHKEGEELTAPDVLPGFRCSISEIFWLPGDQPAAESQPPS